MRGLNNRLLSASGSWIGSSPQLSSPSPTPPPSPFRANSPSPTPSLRGSNHEISPVEASQWHVQSFDFVHASADIKLPPGYESLDVRHQMFGLGQCLELLERQIVLPTHFSQFYSSVQGSMRNKQFIFLRGPEGCGLRTLVTSICQQWRINMLHVSTPVQLSPAQYRPGAFANVLQQACQSKQRTLLLLDRMERYFHPQFFDLCGSELLSEWVRQGLHSCTPQLPIWVVLTGTAKEDDMAPAVWQFMDVAECQFLEADGLVQVMVHCYASLLMAAGVPYDRPSFPREGTLLDREQWQAQLERSTFQAKVMQRYGTFQGIVQRAGERRLWPADARRIVQAAFTQAFKRNTQVIMQGHPAPEDLLPTEQDVQEAALPFLPPPPQDHDMTTAINGLSLHTTHGGRGKNTHRSVSTFGLQ
jgi:hypothetical protein